MFSSYPHSGYRYAQQQRSPDELEALADNLEYRAARARQAARRESIASSNWAPYPPYRYVQPRSQPQSQSFFQPTRVQPRPRQQLEYELEVEVDDFPDFEYTSPRALPLQYQRPRPRAIQHTPIPTPRRTLAFLDLDPVLEEVEFVSAPVSISAEQRRREAREAQVYAAAERARARAHAEAEAQRARDAQARAAVEQQARLARERQQRALLARAKEQEQQKERERVAAARQEQESIENVLALLFGHSHTANANANRPAEAEARSHQMHSQKGAELPASNAHSQQFASVEDFLGQILGVSSARPIPINASNGTQPQLRQSQSGQPTRNVIHNAGFGPHGGIEKHSSSATHPQQHYAPETLKPQAKASLSPSLPVPGRRTFSHLPPNPRDAGLTLTAQQERARADEVADLLEAIKRSLDPRHNAHANATAGSSSSSSSSNSNAALASSPSVSANTAAQPTAPAAAVKPSSDPISIIGAIEAQFVNLTYDFTFPASPDFPPSHPATSAFTPALLFTPTNQPIRAHEHALTGLLTQLDAVDSAGDVEVRRVRKELVSRIEGALQELEGMKAAAWKRVSKSASASESADGTSETKAEVEEEAETEGYVIAEAEPEAVESAPVVERPEAEAVVQTDDEPSSLAQNPAAVAQVEGAHDLPVAAEETEESRAA